MRDLIQRALTKSIWSLEPNKDNLDYVLKIMLWWSQRVLAGRYWNDYNRNVFRVVKLDKWNLYFALIL